MKRYFRLVIVLIMVLGVFIIFKENKKIANTNNMIESKEDTISGYNGLAIMLEDDDGNYTLSTSDTWPTEDYEFNVTLSKCENGGELTWNEGKVTLRTSGSDKCYVYFDKFNPPTVAEFIAALAQGQETITGDGYLYYHDKAGILANGAQDDSYRYAGNNPNNFICFGAGSEEYNNSRTENCPLTNQYRIIGLVPVKKEDGTQDTLVKVIKSEYISNKELNGENDVNPVSLPVDPLPTLSAKLLTPLAGDTGSDADDNKYAYLKRVQGDVTKIDKFSYNSNYNIWSNSKLKDALNTTYLNITLGNSWANKIEKVRWNVGGINYNQLNNIANGVKVLEESITNIEIAQIGLIYIGDYGFASIKDNWETFLINYGNTREKNWLFNGVREWTITPVLDMSISAFYVGSDGNMNSSSSSATNGIRPVFYLKSDVKIISDENTVGTYLHPYKIV